MIFLEDYEKGETKKCPGQGFSSSYLLTKTDGILFVKEGMKKRIKERIMRWSTKNRKVLFENSKSWKGKSSFFCLHDSIHTTQSRYFLINNISLLPPTLCGGTSGVIYEGCAVMFHQKALFNKNVAFLCVNKKCINNDNEILKIKERERVRRSCDYKQLKLLTALVTFYWCLMFIHFSC